MDVHIVGIENRALYTAELEQHFRLRHQVFVERLKWLELRRSDNRDIDEFDSGHAVHLLVVDGSTVLGGSRLISHQFPTLLTTVFPDLVQRPFPDDPSRGAEWSRFYVAPIAADRFGHSPEASLLYCAIMEYALLQDLTFVSFVSTIYTVELGVSIGWKITPLGPPRLHDGKPTVAATIEVSQSALATAQCSLGVDRSCIITKVPNLPGSPFAADIVASKLPAAKKRASA